MHEENDVANTLRLPFPTWFEQLNDAIGLDKCLPFSMRGGDLVAVRRFELAAAISRMHNLEVKAVGG